MAPATDWILLAFLSTDCAGTTTSQRRVWWIAIALQITAKTLTCLRTKLPFNICILRYTMELQDKNWKSHSNNDTALIRKASSYPPTHPSSNVTYDFVKWKSVRADARFPRRIEHV